MVQIVSTFDLSYLKFARDILVSMLGIEWRVLHMLGKRVSLEQHSQPFMNS